MQRPKIKFDPDKILFHAADTNSNDGLRPYADYYQKDGYQLCFIATAHEFNENSATHRLISETFNSFKPEAVIMEGFSIGSMDKWSNEDREFFSDASYEVKENDPNAFGENQHALLLTIENNCAVFTGERSPRRTAAYAREKNYTDDDYLGLRFTDNISHWKDVNLKPEDMPGHWQEYYQGFKQHLSLEMTEDFSSFTTWFKTKHGQDFALEKIDNQFITPDILQPHGSIKHLDALITNFRDRGVLMAIENAMKEYKRIIVVYGGSHYLTLKPALQDGFSGPALKNKSQMPAPG